MSGLLLFVLDLGLAAAAAYLLTWIGESLTGLVSGGENDDDSGGGWHRRPLPPPPRPHGDRTGAPSAPRPHLVSASPRPRQRRP
jgi:hypothetical protein